MTKDSKAASRGVGQTAILVAVGLVALLLGGCARWSIWPDRRPGYRAERRVESGVRFPRAPRPCTQCHSEAQLRWWTSLERQAPEETAACEPYLLVDGDPPPGLDLELVHLPVPGAGPADCRKIVAPVEEAEAAGEEEPEPLRQGLYRLVWRERGGANLPRPIPVWTGQKPQIGGGKQTPVVLWAGPGEPPEVDIAVLSEAGQSVIVLPVPIPEGGGRQAAEERSPPPPKQPIQVVDVQLRRSVEQGDEWIRYELRIDPGDHRVNRAGTRSANASFDEVVCQPQDELILCTGRYQELPADPVTGIPDQEFKIRCLDGLADPCLTVLFSPVSRKPAISGP